MVPLSASQFQQYNHVSILIRFLRLAPRTSPPPRIVLTALPTLKYLRLPRAQLRSLFPSLMRVQIAAYTTYTPQRIVLSWSTLPSLVTSLRSDTHNHAHASSAKHGISAACIRTVILGGDIRTRYPLAWIGKASDSVRCGGCSEDFGRAANCVVEEQLI
jgi:hypothetical protein